jgi:hypothetical protein
MSLDSRWNHLEWSELTVENTWQVDRKSGAPMVKLFREKETGVQEAEVVLDDPRSATGADFGPRGGKATARRLLAGADERARVPKR